MCVFHSSQFTFMEATLKFQTEALPKISYGYWFNLNFAFFGSEGPVVNSPLR